MSVIFKTCSEDFRNLCARRNDKTRVYYTIHKMERKAGMTTGEDKLQLKRVDGMRMIGCSFILPALVEFPRIPLALALAKNRAF